MPAYKLRDPSSGRWFVQMTDIGPQLGPEDKAHVFDSRDEALASDAYRHPMLMLEIVLAREP